MYSARRYPIDWTTRIMFRPLLLLTLLLSPVAYATDNRPPDNRPPDRSGDATVTVQVDPGAMTSESVSDASASSESVSEANATGGSGGSASAAGGNVTFEGQRYRNTPTVIAPDVYPTVSCFRGMSGGAAGSGFGLSLGGGKIDESCVEREEIRLAAQMGLQAQALFRWCNLANNVAAFGSAEACIAYSGSDTVVTHEELNAYDFATESQVDAIYEGPIVEHQVRIDRVSERVEGVSDRVESIEQRLNANAAAAAVAAREREEWKAELAAKYLPEE